MPSRPDLRRRLSSGPPLLLDAAMGTELERRGVHSTLPLWSAHALIEAQEAVEAIHRAQVAAGADAITANTFRTQRRTLEKAGLGARAGELCARAVSLARRAAPDAWVLGSAPPLEDCYRPDLVPGEAALAQEHAEHAGHLAEAGADAILAETHNTLREAVAAVRAARETGLPVIVSFVCGPGALLLSGEPLAAALDAVLRLEPTAVGVNCLPPSQVAACLPALAEAGAPFGVYANLGAPGPNARSPRSEECSPRDYAAHAQRWLDAGAQFVGGCCGTTAAHVRAIATQLPA